MSTKKGSIYRSLCCLESTCIIRIQIQDLARRHVSRCFWEAVRLASLLGVGASRVAFRRRRVSRCFWESARLASLLGGGASRVAFGRQRVSRRFWEAARLASLFKKFLSLGGAASEARRSGWGYSAFQTTPPLRGTPPREGEILPDRAAVDTALRLFPWSWICKNYAEAQEVVTMDRYAVVPVRGAAVLGVVVPAAAAADSARAAIFIFPVARVAR